MQTKPQQQKQSPAGAKTAAPGGAIDIQKLVDAAYKDIPANLRPMLDRVVLSGMRIMFDKSSHQMMLDELDKPGPLAERLQNGIISLMYMLWEQSNKTIPPQLIVPATLILALRAFDFLQRSEEPEATKETLGEAVSGAVNGVMERFGVNEQNLPQLVKGGAQQPGAPAPSAPGAAPAGAGMLDSIGGA